MSEGCRIMVVMTEEEMKVKEMRRSKKSRIDTANAG
jgi:hypothetical protein